MVEDVSLCSVFIASLKCTDLTSIGASGLSALTTTQISNIQDQDFLDCAELLGSVTDWSDAQKEALVAVAKRSTVRKDHIIVI